MSHKRDEWNDSAPRPNAHDRFRVLLVFAVGLMTGCILTSGAVYAWIDFGFRK